MDPVPAGLSADELRSLADMDIQAAVSDGGDALAWLTRAGSAFGGTRAAISELAGAVGAGVPGLAFGTLFDGDDVGGRQGRGTGSGLIGSRRCPWCPWARRHWA